MGRSREERNCRQSVKALFFRNDKQKAAWAVDCWKCYVVELAFEHAALLQNAGFRQLF